jgi:hypothetical protein
MDTSSERMADCHESLRDSLRGSVYRPDVMVNRLTHRIPDTPRRLEHQLSALRGSVQRGYTSPFGDHRRLYFVHASPFDEHRAPFLSHSSPFDNHRALYCVHTHHLTTTANCFASSGRHFTTTGPACMTFFPIRPPPSSVAAIIGPFECVPEAVFIVLVHSSSIRRAGS